MSISGGRRRRAAPSFSLSFLDVIACATGIAIFLAIMMLVVTEQAVPEDLRRRFEEARRNSPAQRRIIEEARELERQSEVLAALETQLAALTRQTEEANNLVAAATERTSLESAIRELESQLRTAGTQTAADAQRDQVQEILNRRSPFLRQSRKRENVWLFFHRPGWVRVIERTSGRFSSSHFRDATLPLGRHTVLKAINDGITVDELIATGGVSADKFRSFDRAREYIGCYVNPVAGCHDDFVRVREVLYRAGIEVGFRFEFDHDVALFGPDGSQAPVQ